MFSNEMEKKPKYHTYFSIEFGKSDFHSKIVDIEPFKYHEEKY